MSQVMKYAKKQFKRLGFEVVYEGRHQVTFRHPAGRSRTVTNTQPLSHVRDMVSNVENWVQALKGIRAFEYPVTDEYPQITDTNYVSSIHFRERLEWMRTQELSTGDVVRALMQPETVRDGCDRLYYCYCDVVIPVGKGRDERGRHVAITLLWAWKDLWVERPRPEDAP